MVLKAEGGDSIAAFGAEGPRFEPWWKETLTHETTIATNERRKRKDIKIL